MYAVYTRRRSRAGDSQQGCLLFILLMVVIGFVGYNYFIKNYNLKHAGKQVYAWQDRNPDAFHQYRKKMVNYTIKDTFVCAQEARTLFGQLKAGKIDQKEFNKESNKVINRLSELIDEVNGRAAPKVFHKPAIALATAHGDFYKCLTKLQKLPNAKTPEEQKKLYDDAWADWLSGFKNATIAQKGIRLDIDYNMTK